VYEELEHTGTVHLPQLLLGTNKERVVQGKVDFLFDPFDNRHTTILTMALSPSAKPRTSLAGRGKHQAS
jgi:hypothetical protein